MLLWPLARFVAACTFNRCQFVTFISTRKSRGFTFLVARYLQIQELLDRVADRDNHDLHQSQAHDTLHMEEDQFAMDFSDTLFSTLSQTNHSSGKDEFCKFVCSVIGSQ